MNLLLSLQSSRYLFLFTAYIFFLFSSNAFCAAHTLAGKWEYIERSNDSSVPSAVLDLSLTVEKNGVVVGSYCFVTQSGNRIDCGNDENSKNISGHLKQGNPGKALVKFNSFFGAKNGVAELTLNENISIDWMVLNLPKGGGFYGPKHAVLRRVSSGISANQGERDIVVDKAYLFDQASVAERHRTYLIKGDHVRLIKQSEDLRFWQIEFSTQGRAPLRKWINCRDIDFCANQAMQ